MPRGLHILWVSKGLGTRVPDRTSRANEAPITLLGVPTVPACCSHSKSCNYQGINQFPEPSTVAPYCFSHKKAGEADPILMKRSPVLQEGVNTGMTFEEGKKAQLVLVGHNVAYPAVVLPACPVLQCYEEGGYCIIKGWAGGSAGAHVRTLLFSHGNPED